MGPEEQTRSSIRRLIARASHGRRRSRGGAANNIWFPPGMIEACYHREAAEELLLHAKGLLIEENFNFVISVNYLLCLRVGHSMRFNRLGKLVEHPKKVILTKSKISTVLQSVFDKHIRVGSREEVNVDRAIRDELLDIRETICSGQMVWSLIPLRDVVARVAYHQAVDNMLAPTMSANVKQYLAMETSPTDEAIMNLLKGIIPTGQSL